MARGALRGAAGAVMSLIVLQGLTGKASGRVGGLVDALNQLVFRALDPTVAAIPDHSHTASGSASGSVTAEGNIAGAFDGFGNPIPAGLEHAGQTGQTLADLAKKIDQTHPYWATPTPAPATRVPIPAPAVHPLS